MQLEVGKYYRTRGGWRAIVIWEKPDNVYPPFLVIHKPHTADESEVIIHAGDGKACTTFSVNEPPHYNGLPADLIEKWKKDKENKEQEELKRLRKFEKENKQIVT